MGLASTSTVVSNGLVITQIASDKYRILSLPRRGRLDVYKDWAGHTLGYMLGISQSNSPLPLLIALP